VVAMDRTAYLHTLLLRSGRDTPRPCSKLNIQDSGRHAHAQSQNSRNTSGVIIIMSDVTLTFPGHPRPGHHLSPSRARGSRGVART